MTFKVPKQKKQEPKQETFKVLTGKQSQAETFRMNSVGKEYNGWTNYTTWNVALNIDSEQGLKEDIYTQIKEGNINNGYELKNYFKQTLEDSENYDETYNAYKLSDAWTDRELESDVNWYEIYKIYKKDVDGNEEYEKKKQEVD